MATLTISGACVIKAGLNVNSKFTGTDAETEWNALIAQAEGAICTETRFNWVTTYSTLNDDVRRILEDAASSHAAIAAINYDMGGYNTQEEVTSMLDVNYARFRDAMNLLKEVDKGSIFVQEA